MGYELDDATENVGGIPGCISKRKTGDFVITLGDTSAAPGEKIVVEAKNESGYDLNKAIEEIKLAKQNRKSKIGILAFETNCVPTEIVDFRQVGDDFFVSVDWQDLKNGIVPIYLEAAYKVARALIVTAIRKEKSEEMDIGLIKTSIDSILESVKKFSDIKKKAITISNNSKFIEDIVGNMEEDITSHLDRITELLK
jgi:hypothetical protein